MTHLNRWKTWVLAIAAVLLTGVLVVVYLRTGRMPGIAPAIQESGEGFPLGENIVSCTYGYSDDGDRLRYAIIRSWPATTSASERLSDPRVDRYSGPLPRIRHNDGVMRPVGTDGHVYLFIDEELRTMQVSMNEHSDTIGLSHAKTLEDMWEYVQQFRVAK
jgi:hypothetical protein